MNLGALPAVWSLVSLLYVLGLLLFGIALFRAHIVPLLYTITLLIMRCLLLKEALLSSC